MFRVVIASFALAVAALGAGCGDQIGDSCQIASDCSPTGGRICDQTSPDGYCTVIGCDFDTCPEEAVCVRFFPNAAGNVDCDPATEDQPGDAGTDTCLPSQLCALGGVCVERTSEIRFCMKRCEGSGDCRERYECRDEALMIANGGEPVPEPGEPVNTERSFCAAAPNQSLAP